MPSGGRRYGATARHRPLTGFPGRVRGMMRTLRFMAVSGVRRPVSGVSGAGSGVRCSGSGVRCPVSGPGSGVRCPVSGVGFLDWCVSGCCLFRLRPGRGEPESARGHHGTACGGGQGEGVGDWLMRCAFVRYPARVREGVPARRSGPVRQPPSWAPVYCGGCGRTAAPLGVPLPLATSAYAGGCARGGGCRGEGTAGGCSVVRTWAGRRALFRGARGVSPFHRQGRACCAVRCGLQGHAPGASRARRLGGAVGGPAPLSRGPWGAEPPSIASFRGIQVWFLEPLQSRFGVIGRGRPRREGICTVFRSC